MDSRDILSKTELIRFLLDTDSLNTQAYSEDSILDRFLTYKRYDGFEFRRTPSSTGYERLQNISSYQVKKDEEKNGRTLRWDSENPNAHGARYLPELYEHWAHETDWDEPNPTLSDLEFLDLFSEIIRRQDQYADILVTLNPAILKNRRLIEYQIRSHQRGRMHIMEPSEAVELAGIYMRERGDFLFYDPYDERHTYKIDFTLWYWTIVKIFVKHFTADEEGLLGSVLDRFEFLFIGIDKLGGQYYRGTGNHTDRMTRYHFNYGISLLTGIFDSLAIHTRNKYNINILDKDTNLRTGNHPLLKELRTHNKQAWEYVHSNHEIIELLHVVRNDVIHQSGVIRRGPGYSYREHGETTEWKSQTLDMGELSESDRENFKKYYTSLNDSIQEYDPVTVWGVVTTGSEVAEITDRTQIEPYRFLKQATRYVVEFTDEYLRLLGHPNWMEGSLSHGPISERDIQYVVEQGLHPFLNELDPESIT